MRLYARVGHYISGLSLSGKSNVFWADPENQKIRSLDLISCRNGWKIMKICYFTGIYMSWWDKLLRTFITQCGVNQIMSLNIPENNIFISYFKFVIGK